MIVIGVDPGMACALALVCSKRGWLAVAHDDEVSMKVSKTKRRPLAVLLAEKIGGWTMIEGAEVVVSEKIGAWTGQGIVSTAEFTRASGMVEGVAAGFGLPYRELTPAVWKRQMKLITLDKDASRGAAAKLWPDRASWLTRKGDHHKAEAALIAQAWIETHA